MAYRNRMHSILARSVAATGIMLCLADSPAQGQGISTDFAQRESLLDDFDERLREASRDRTRANSETHPPLVAGWCESRLSRLNSLHDTVERYQAQISEADLATYRQALARERAYPCPRDGLPPPPPPPPLPPPFERTDAYRQWEPVYSQIALDLYEAEQDRLAGNCLRRGNRLSNAARGISEITTELSRQGPAFGNRFGGAGLSLYRERLQAEVARPCPPDAPLPIPPAQVASPPTPPAQGITQEDADAVARQQASFDSMRMSVAIGYGETGVPRTNYGFVRDGPAGAAEERPGAFGERRIPALMVEAQATFRDVGRFTLGYRQGDANNRTEIAPSTAGGAQGVVGEAPSGSTGVAGNLGLTVDTEVRSREVSVGYDHIFGAFFDGENKPGRYFYAGATVDFGGGEHRGVESIIRTTAPPISVVQTLEQEIDELRIGAVLGGELRVPISTNFRFGMAAEGFVYYYDFDLATVRTRAQNIGPTSDQAFTVNSENSENGVGYGSSVRAEFAVDVSGADRPRGVELFVAGEARYLSDRAQIVNLFSGDQVLAGETIRLGTDDAFDWSMSIGMRIRLGGGRFRF